MDVQSLARQMEQSGVTPQPELLRRWLEVIIDDEKMTFPYADFVDETARLWDGFRPARAWLDQDDPRDLVVSLGQRNDAQTLVFLDWSRQDLSWPEIVELWNAWNDQSMVIDCGGVAISPRWGDRWGCPAWILFQGDFDGEPLRVVKVTSSVSGPTMAASEGSFLARAQALKPGGTRTSGAGNSPLPQIPFTLETMNTPLAAGPWREAR